MEQGVAVPERVLAGPESWSSVQGCSFSTETCQCPAQPESVGSHSFPAALSPLPLQTRPAC